MTGGPAPEAGAPPANARAMANGRERVLGFGGFFRDPAESEYKANICGPYKYDRTTERNRQGRNKSESTAYGKFLSHFSCNFIGLRVTISLWSKLDQSGLQWKKTAKSSPLAPLMASSR